MIDNVLSNHIDNWYSNSIIDCGEVVNEVEDFYEEPEPASEPQAEKEIKSGARGAHAKGKHAAMAARGAGAASASASGRQHVHLKYQQYPRSPEAPAQAAASRRSGAQGKVKTPTSRLQEFKKNGRPILLDTFPKFRNIKI
jgi:hypothetical protein